MSRNKEIEIYSNSKDAADKRIARMEQRMIEENNIRTDFENVVDQAIFLHPNESNPIHQEKVAVWFDGKYFTSDMVSAVFEGPDYYLGDVLTYNHGFTLE